MVSRQRHEGARDAHGNTTPAAEAERRQQSARIMQAIKHADTPAQLQLLYAQHCSALDWLHIAAALSAFARAANPAGSAHPMLPQEARLTLQLLLAAFHENLDQYAPRQLSHSIWVLGKFGCSEQGALLRDILWRLLQPGGRGYLGGGNCLDVANTAWGLARLQQRGEALWRRLGDVAVAECAAAGPQEITNIVWAFARAGVRHAELLQLAARRLIVLLPDASPQQACNVLWAYAKLGCRDPELFDAALRRLKPRLRYLTPQGCANVLWALATAGHRADERLLRGLARSALLSVRRMTPQGLSNVVWALQTLHHRDDKLLQAVAQQAALRCSEFNLLGLCTVLEACGRRANDALLRAVAPQVPAQLQDAKPSSLARIIMALGRSGYYDEKLYDALAAAALKHMDAWGPNELVGTLASFAVAWHQHPCIQRGAGRRTELVAAVARRLPMGSLTRQQLVRLVGAVARLQHEDRALWAELRRLVAQQLLTFSPSQLAALLHAFAIMLQATHVSHANFASDNSGAEESVDGGSNSSSSDGCRSKGPSKRTRDDPIVGELTAALTPRLPHLRCSELAHVIWAAAVAGLRDRRWHMSALQLAAIVHGGSMTPAATAKLLAAMAATGHVHGELLDLLLHGAALQLPTYTLSQLLDVATAASDLGVADAGWWQAAGVELRGKLQAAASHSDAASGDAVRDAVWRCAAFRHKLPASCSQQLRALAAATSVEPKSASARPTG